MSQSLTIFIYYWHIIFELLVHHLVESYRMIQQAALPKQHWYDQVKLRDPVRVRLY